MAKVCVRFFKTGLLEVEVPKDFKKWTEIEQREFCEKAMEETSDVDLLKCMCDMKTDSDSLKDISEAMFDQLPDIQAIEHDDEGLDGLMTERWVEYAFGVENDDLQEVKEGRFN